MVNLQYFDSERLKGALDDALEHPKLLAAAATVTLGIGASAYYLHLPDLGLPGPSGNAGPEFARGLENGNIHQVFQRWREEYGHTWRCRIFLTNYVFTSDSRFIEWLLKDHATFPRQESAIRAPRWAFQAVFAMEGAEWKRRRQAIKPAFSPKTIRWTFDVTLKKLDQLVSMIGKRQSFRTGDLIQRFVSDVNTLFLLSHDLKALEDPAELEKITSAVRILQQGIARRVAVPTILWPFIKDHPGTAQARQQCARIFAEILKKKKENDELSNDTHEDLMSALVKAGTLTDEELVNEMMGLFLGSQDSVAAATTRMIYEVYTKPHVLDRARKEIEQVFGSTPTPLKAFEDVSKVPYCKGIVQEVIRFQPMLPFDFRETSKDVEIEHLNLKIPKGTAIVLDLLGVMSRPDYFPEPHTFKPERWLDSDKWLVPGSYVPFGGGPSICPGRKFAHVIMTIVLVTLVMNFDITFPDDFKHQVVYGVVAKVLDANVQVKQRTF